jgi:hypothetical protein
MKLDPQVVTKPVHPLTHSRLLQDHVMMIRWRRPSTPIRSTFSMSPDVVRIPIISTIVNPSQLDRITGNA